MIKMIHGEIYSQDFTQLDHKCEIVSSCGRYAYCRFRNDHLSLNEVRELCKYKYPTLNVRYRYDAINYGLSVFTRFQSQKVIFGGKLIWKQYNSGLITKEEWRQNRNKQLYSRGEADKHGNGNVNARIIGNRLRINIRDRYWEFYDLFIPEKYQLDLQYLLASGQSYSVRLIKRDCTHYRVVIDYSIEDPKATIDFSNGVIGVDINVDHLAICEISPDGNYIKSTSFPNEKLLFASTEKRDYEIAHLVQLVIKYALKTQKGIIFENLDFEKDFDYRKKRNRKLANFVWRKFITLLERKCIENKIKYKKVPPAFTSEIGKNKYKDLYNISIHESAAYVIGRRGLGYKEELSLYGYTSGRVKEAVLRHYERKKNERVYSWKLWSILRGNREAVLTGLSSSMFNPRELNDISKLSLDNLDVLDNEGETPSSRIFLLQQYEGSQNIRNNVLPKEESLSQEASDFS